MSGTVNGKIYDAIEIQAAMQWQRALGEMRALVELLGKVPAEYKDGMAVRGRHYEHLSAEFESFVKKIEHNDWHMPDRV